ncbi:hypothetical protein [Maribacter sp. 1_MG-2023]|uniref:hypothetical protein n=1 Tax=Maribacter sp. 1_MG-2023 TaxID=3062677 RepID=UPI0026E27035|nr:hypothetical protein [Maribacter sp. 1_MG-2023]MDO6473309.1 hypothetical protein [Maribacter sp. 1_MG-2023]
MRSLSRRGNLFHVCLSVKCSDSAASGVIGAYVECVAFEIPRGIRINSINLSILEEAWDIYGEMIPSFQTVTFTIMFLAI